MANKDRSIEEKLVRFRDAVVRIIAKAKEDGIITQQEAELIKIAEKRLGEFEKMVIAALDDNIITQEERNKLIDLEEMFMSDSYYQAVEDTIIDKDELALLKTLFHTLAPRQSLTWLDEDLK